MAPKPQDSKQKAAILDFIQQVLDRRFPTESLKRVIDGSEQKKISFACPFCGDSQKKASKKRGNLYLDTMRYVCFNDGCGAKMAFRKFVKNFAQKFGIVPNIDVFDEAEIIDVPVSTINSLIDFLRMPKENLISIEELEDRFGIKPVDELPEDSIVRGVIERRGLFHVPHYADYLYADKRDDKIYIFNVGTRSGKILGFAVRALDGSARRYMIRDYKDLGPAFPDHKITETLRNACNEFNNFFNILNLDFTQPITVLEGQIDSLFVRNSVATTGVSKSVRLLSSLGPKRNIRILFDRDKGGKTEMIKLITSGYSVFLWNVLAEKVKRTWSDVESLTEFTNTKDINDLFSFIAKRRDVTYDAFNEFIDGFFSTSQFDIVFI